MKKLILLSMILISFGCLKKKDDEVISSGKVSSEFHGTWEACFVDGTDSFKIRQIISDASVIHSETFFINSTSCLGSEALVNVESTNTVTKQKPLTLKMIRTTITPMSSIAASNLNISLLCGNSAWSSGVAHDVSGRVCSSDLDFSDSTPFAVYYTKNGNSLNVSDGDDSEFTLTRVP